jgi:hypothetical protein
MQFIFEVILNESAINESAIVAEDLAPAVSPWWMVSSCESAKGNKDRK